MVLTSVPVHKRLDTDGTARRAPQAVRQVAYAGSVGRKQDIGGRSMKQLWLSVLYLIALILPAFAAELSATQKKELVVFTGRAMGMKTDVDDVKQTMSVGEIERLVATGLNLNRYLCSQIVEIRPLELTSTYEVTCIAYGGGTVKKAYIVDALKGVAFEP
jgi:hypothetical protein